MIKKNFPKRPGPDKWTSLDAGTTKRLRASPLNEVDLTDERVIAEEETSAQKKADKGLRRDPRRETRNQPWRVKRCRPFVVQAANIEI